MRPCQKTQKTLYPPTVLALSLTVLPVPDSPAQAKDKPMPVKIANSRGWQNTGGRFAKYTRTDILSGVARQIIAPAGQYAKRPAPCFLQKTAS